MEPTLHVINAKYVSVPETEAKQNDIILHKVLGFVTQRMKDVSPLFKSIFQEYYFGGSYYDGLKVGKPDEYDIDLLLKFPKCKCWMFCHCYELETSNKPGSVWMKVADTSNDEIVTKFVKSGYLDTNKVKSWMQGIIQLALNCLTNCRLVVDDGSFKITFRNSGPAFTLHVETWDNRYLIMRIDLVPCFLLNNWPANGFEKNPTSEIEVFIVPKPLNGDSRYWRMSFQKQERKLMHGLNRFKPTVRLLKKLRDSMGHHAIKSYYIKTVALWEIKNNDKSFWDKSYTEVFMTILLKYQKCIEEHNIPYYWYKKKNLLEDVNRDTSRNISQCLKRAINDIKMHPDDLFIVAKYILTLDEYQELMSDDKEAIEEENRKNSQCIIL